MKRRRFIGVALGITAAFAGPLRRVCARAIPVRWTEALRAKRYPGRVVKPRGEAAGKSGKWAG